MLPRLLLLILFCSFTAHSESINNGTDRQIFENGTPKYEITYKNELKHGKETFWYESGQKKWKVIFLMELKRGFGGNGTKMAS